jgi:hypothetical protein
MQPQNILAELKKRGLFLNVGGEKLHIIGPSASLDAEILEEIRAAKSALISLLTAPSPEPPHRGTGSRAPRCAPAAIYRATKRIRIASCMTAAELHHCALIMACLELGIEPPGELLTGNAAFDLEAGENE